MSLVTLKRMVWVYMSLLLLGRNTRIRFMQRMSVGQVKYQNPPTAKVKLRPGLTNDDICKFARHVLQSNHATYVRYMVFRVEITDTATV